MKIDNKGNKNSGELQSYVAEGGETVITKDGRILFKGKSIRGDAMVGRGLSDDEIIKKMTKFTRRLDARDKMIVIIDPYILPCRADNSYLRLLSNIITDIAPKELLLVLKKYYKPTTDRFIELICHIPVMLFENDDFHDRFWICPETEKGIVVGTSLNGVGKKLCYVNNLEFDDVHYIVNRLCELDIPIRR